MTQATRELSSTKRDEVIRHLHLFVKGGRLTHGAFAKTAEALEVSARAVSYTWRKFRNDGTTKSSKAGNVGRRLRYTSQAIQQRVGAVPIDQRSTMRDISVATGIALGTLSRHLKKGTFRRRSTRIKPLLSDANKVERVACARGYEKLESVFLTFQAVMRLVLEHAGDNNFALPHLKKAALRRAGLLMSNVSCPVSLLL
ncbi:hypothetical protein DYB37_009171 [Aphanomyces astaci]|uniref:Transposase Tc1-like domain-containing protein n=1 Tax=Aphanomyces astaci TaxID=112090 RepID=A0A418ECZ0_APHAT|nr:hypothetical protein DYB37_009171 [Aphanomyces astaci]